MIRQAYDALQPGGYLELNDIHLPFLADDGTMKGTALETWSNRMVEACGKLGIDTTVSSRYKQMLADAGFEDIVGHSFKWPVGTWPKDPVFKKMGKLTLVNFLSGIEGFTVRLWTGALGMTLEDTTDFLVQVKKDVVNPNIHSYWPV